MFLKLLVLFIGIPLLEIAILVKMGETLGFWTTMFIVLVTAVTGASLARLEGLRILTRIHQELQSGILPTEDLVDGLLILVAGIVLLTPGFFTDTIGILILIPWTRAIFKKWLKNRFKRYIETHRGSSFHFDLN